MDDVRVMKHEGTCYKNTTHAPASAEHYQSEEAARRLLLDDAGNYKSDDEMLFGCKVVTDNDTYCKYPYYVILFQMPSYSNTRIFNVFYKHQKSSLRNKID